MSNETHFDILITGSGMVGMSLALALAPLSLRIGLIDTKPLASSHTQNPSSLDARAITLSQSSVDLLHTLQIWESCAAHATKIRHIHISNKGAFGIARLSADEMNCDALGYVIEAHTLYSFLLKALADHPQIIPLMPMRVETMTEHERGLALHLAPLRDASCARSSGRTVVKFSAPLIIAADGAHSTLRQLRNIPATSHDYTQNAIVATLQLQRDHDHIAYERFGPDGPFAMLPLSHRRAGMVLTVPTDQSAYFLALSDPDFLAYAQKHFGYRLGRFLAVGPRQSYPLIASCAQQHVQPGFVLMGNAAHTLHPVAGQGLNLGLRDVAHLVETLKYALTHARPLNDPSLLKAYETRRLHDQHSTFRFTDTLVRLFSNPSSLTRLARNWGLLVFDLFPFLKNALLKSHKN